MLHHSGKRQELEAAATVKNGENESLGSLGSAHSPFTPQVFSSQYRQDNALRHAHMLIWFKQSLNESLFPGGSRRCQLIIKTIILALFWLTPCLNITSMDHHIAFLNTPSCLYLVYSSCYSSRFYSYTDILPALVHGLTLSLYSCFIHSPFSNSHFTT